MMVKVLLYAYCVGVPSSRKIEKRLEEDVAFRVLAANNTTNFRTISDFRKDHLKALSGLFLQVLKLCRKAGLVNSFKRTKNRDLPMPKTSSIADLSNNPWQYPFNSTFTCLVVNRL